MSDDPEFRQAQPDDIEPAFAVFRRALFDYMFTVGMATEEERKDPPIASAWPRQQGWIRHLWNTAAENWVAVEAGKVVGWALSIERDRHRELAIFFVDPAVQTKGIGRELLRRTFSGEQAARRTVVATQNPKALGQYLRSGVEFVTTAMDVVVTCGPAAAVTDLVFEPAVPGDGAVEIIGDLEQKILGFRRPLDIAFLLGDRQAWIVRRGGRPVGYVFGVPFARSKRDTYPTGPMAALVPEDLLPIIDFLLAQEQEGETLAISLPMSNHMALRHLLARGGQIDPFFVAILSTEKDMKLDRYVHTSPAFIL